MLFITGANSFVGKSLLNECKKRKIKFIGIDKNCKKSKNIFKVDITKDDISPFLPKKSYIIHLAAISTDKDCKQNFKLAIKTNIEGTQNLIEVAKKKHAKQLIFASSEWIYGDIKSNKEKQYEKKTIDLIGNSSEYAVTKIMGEKLCRFASDNFVSTILRFGIIYGPRLNNWSAIENLFYNVATQSTVKVGSKLTARRFIYIDDIVSGILSSVGRKKSEVFNLTGNKLINLEKVITLSKKILTKKIEIIETDKKVYSIRNPINSYAKKQLKWNPKTSLEKGLKEIKIFFYKKNIL
jgi:nucleoside-diphosphate-sugar epimerase